MRKATIILTLALLLSICGVGALAAGVYGQRDQVVLAENAIHGDPAAADDLTVQLRTTSIERCGKKANYLSNDVLIFPLCVC